MRTVTKAFLRYVVRRRGLVLLQLMGIACGVAAVIGMFYSSQAALSSFRRSIEFLRGDATHTLRRFAGPLNEHFLLEIMRDPAVIAFSPVIDRLISLEQSETVRLLGIDPILDRIVRPDLAQTVVTDGKSSKRLLSFLTEPNAVFLDARVARRQQLATGDTFHTERGEFYIAGMLAIPSGEPLMLIDISNAQRIFGLPGLIDAVEMVLVDPEGFKERWKNGFEIQSRHERKTAFSEMIVAYRLNLEALSLLALFVGVFLVYNMSMFTIISRRKDAGILCGLGARRSEIVFAFGSEIILLGATGGALGGLLGFGLCRLLTTVMSRTISDLYFYLYSAPPEWSYSIILAGICLGCAASLLGSFFPLMELVRVDPVKMLYARTNTSVKAVAYRNVLLAAITLLFVSGILLWFSSSHVYIGFGGAFFMMLGASLLTGTAMKCMSPWLIKIFSAVGGLPGKIAAGNIFRNPGRSAVAVATFMVALSMSVGLGTMIGSFRSSLQWWMGGQLSADLYIAPSVEVEVPPQFYEKLKQNDAIAGIDTYRNVQIAYENSIIKITAVNARVLQKFTDFQWLHGNSEAWDGVAQGDAIVSESFYRRFNKSVGDRIVLDGLGGPEQLRIAGVFYDYTTEHGLIMLDRSRYVAIYDDNTIDSLAVFLDTVNQSYEQTADDIRSAAAQFALPIATREDMHANIMEIFETTFSMTRSMRYLAVIVAFFGIAGAILVLFIERQREFGIYRALGFSTSQVGAITLMESVGMGFLSFVLCSIVGTVLAVVLIRVINLQSFNWTIFYQYTSGPYVLAAVTAVAASLGAAVYPIWKICYNYPQIQIRDE